MPKLVTVCSIPDGIDDRVIEIVKSVMSEYGEIQGTVFDVELVPDDEDLGIDRQGVPFARFTAEVEPNEANKEAAYGRP